MTRMPQFKDDVMLCLGVLYAFFNILGLSVVSATTQETCDVSKCIPHQLEVATKNNDKAMLCRLLTPALNCMERKLPVCRKTMDDDQKFYDIFVRQLNKLERSYAKKCKKIVTSCQGISECLHTDLLNANYERDTNLICKHGPIAVDCVRVVLDKCEKEIGYRDANMDMLENYMDKLHRKVSASCDAVSSLFGTRVLMVPILLVLAQVVMTSFNTRVGPS